MSGFQSPITIWQAIGRIKNNEYLLPAFQREYVWSSNQVENLFDSLMKGYPISSMLFWKVKNEAKNAYKFYKILDKYVERYNIHNDTFNTNQVNDFYAILDGQQRLTSLYIGLCGSYAFHRYRARWDNSDYNFPERILYLNISRTFPEDESDKTYNFSFKEKSFTQGKVLFQDTNGDKWFKVGEILKLGDGDSDYGIFEFSDEYSLTKEERSMLNKLRSKIFDKPVINFYEIEDSKPDVAVNIFVRINSGGTQLSFSNMLMSMAIAGWQKKDARTEILRLVDLVNNKGFNITQDYILKAFLYLYKTDVRFRIKGFDNEFIDLVEEKWESIRDCIDELFELLKNYGLDRSSLTSNNATLPILYYLYHRNIYKSFSSAIGYADERKEIRLWLMRTLIFRSFSVSGDTILQLSRKAFTDNIDLSFIKDGITSFPSDTLSSTIRQPTEINDEYIDSHILNIHKDNKFAFAVLALLYSNLDYRNPFHKDHIHPFVRCQSVGFDWEEYDTILNLQMLDANENMAKNDKELKEWVEFETTPETRDSFLKSHLIPDVNLELENFPKFIVERRKLLHERFKKLFKRDTANVITTVPEDDFEELEDEIE